MESYIVVKVKLVIDIVHLTRQVRWIMMFEDLDKFIAENPEEVLVTGGWTDDKVSELEKQLGIAFREEVKIFMRKYGV